MARKSQSRRPKLRLWLYSARWLEWTRLLEGHATHVEERRRLTERHLPPGSRLATLPIDRIPGDEPKCRVLEVEAILEYRKLKRKGA